RDGPGPVPGRHARRGLERPPGSNVDQQGARGSAPGRAAPAHPATGGGPGRFRAGGERHRTPGTATGAGAHRPARHVDRRGRCPRRAPRGAPGVPPTRHGVSAVRALTFPVLATTAALFLLYTNWPVVA